MNHQWVHLRLSHRSHQGIHRQFNKQTHTLVEAALVTGPVTFISILQKKYTNKKCNQIFGQFLLPAYKQILSFLFIFVFPWIAIVEIL